MLGKNIYSYRKKLGLSQEQLAEKIEVSRQTISNWELGETQPNPDQLKLLSFCFSVSVDELIGNTHSFNRRTYGYEYVSKTKIKGLPLVHINLGLGHDLRKAKGVIAIGNMAKGIIALGGISLGIFSLGGLSCGLISMGGLALGLLLAIGGLSVGSVSVGGIAIGFFAIGGLALGIYSIGGCSLAKRIAVGEYAFGHIAIGNHVNGEIEILANTFSPKEIEKIIREVYPNIWSFLVYILAHVKW